VRVGTVSQGQSLVTHARGGPVLLLGIEAGVLLSEVVRDGGIVARRLLKRLQGEALSGGLGDRAVRLELGDDGVVVGRGADD
jgi:hypothetical protein